jgi:hypothetical protein
MVMALAMGGCPPQMDPESQQRLAYMTSSDSYQATAKILVAYRQADKIGDEDWQRVKVWDTMAFEGLEAWRAALVDGVSPEAAILQVNTALQELLKQRLAAQGGQP